MFLRKTSTLSNKQTKYKETKEEENRKTGKEDGQK